MLENMDVQAKVNEFEKVVNEESILHLGHTNFRINMAREIYTRMVCELTAANPNFTLEQIKPLTDAFVKYRDKYKEKKEIFTSSIGPGGRLSAMLKNLDTDQKILTVDPKEEYQSSPFNT
jgi:hypothetical protein